MKVLWLSAKPFYTTRRVTEEAAKLKIDFTAAEMADVSFAVDKKSTVTVGGRDLFEFDVLIVRTGYPHISESLTLARLFREAGKMVIDETLAASEVPISKINDYFILNEAGIDVPRTWQLHDPKKLEEQAKKLGYPCVLKGVHGSGGQHVYKIHDAAELKKIYSHYPDGKLALQEFIPAEKDYRVITIGYKALPMILEQTPGPGEFKTNLSETVAVKARHLSEFPEIKIVAERASKILKREFAAADIRYKNGKPVVLELNRRPGFEGYEANTGLNVAGEFLKYIRRKYSRINKRARS